MVGCAILSSSHRVETEASGKLCAWTKIKQLVQREVWCLNSGPADSKTWASHYFALGLAVWKRALGSQVLNPPTPLPVSLCHSNRAKAEVHEELGYSTTIVTNVLACWHSEIFPFGIISFTLCYFAGLHYWMDTLRKDSKQLLGMWKFGLFPGEEMGCRMWGKKKEAQVGRAINPSACFLFLVPVASVIANGNSILMWKL